MVSNFRALLLTLLVLQFASSAPGQTPGSPKDEPTAPGLIKLAGEDEKRAKELDKQIDDAMKADRWDEAIAKAEELLALRTRAQGPRHFETANLGWRLKALRKVAPMPKEDRVAYQSPYTLQGQADALVAQGKYSQAQPLFEQALEIYRRLLTDDHPDTALGYDNVALNLNAQGKYAAAQPLYEKALAIRHGLLTDDHPATATSYNNVAHNLNAQERKYAAAQPLFGEGRWRFAAGCSASIYTGHRRWLQQRSVQPQRAGEVRGGPAVL